MNVTAPHSPRARPPAPEGEQRRCHCGCGASLEGFRPSRKWRYTSCRPQREPNNEYEVAMTTVVKHDPCAYCGRRGHRRNQIVGDHVTPIDAGGERDWTNITAACTFCNSSKGADPLLLFMLRLREYQC